VSSTVGPEPSYIDAFALAIYAAYANGTGRDAHWASAGAMVRPMSDHSLVAGLRKAADLIEGWPSI
jgi:hypothetical protein